MTLEQYFNKAMTEMACGFCATDINPIYKNLKEAPEVLLKQQCSQCQNFLQYFKNNVPQEDNTV